MAVKCDKPIPGWRGDVPESVGVIPTALDAPHWLDDTWEDAVLSWGG